MLLEQWFRRGPNERVIPTKKSIEPSKGVNAQFLSVLVRPLRGERVLAISSSGAPPRVRVEGHASARRLHGMEPRLREEVAAAVARHAVRVQGHRQRRLSRRLALFRRRRHAQKTTCQPGNAIRGQCDPGGNAISDDGGRGRLVRLCLLPERRDHRAISTDHSLGCRPKTSGLDFGLWSPRGHPQLSLGGL